MCWSLRPHLVHKQRLNKPLDNYGRNFDRTLFEKSGFRLKCCFPSYHRCVAGKRRTDSVDFGVTFVQQLQFGFPKLEAYHTGLLLILSILFIRFFPKRVDQTSHCPMPSSDVAGLLNCKRTVLSQQDALASETHNEV